MSFPAQIGMHVAVALALCGLVWLGVVVVGMLLKTRPQGGGKSAGSAKRASHHPRAAKAKGAASPEAADTVPDGGVALPPPPSGTPEWRARMIDAWPDPIDVHIDTAAALLQPDQDFFGWADDVDAWLAAGCPAVWPIPVVPGGEHG